MSAYGSEVGAYHPYVLVGYGDDRWAFMRPDGMVTPRFKGEATRLVHLLAASGGEYVRWMTQQEQNEGAVWGRFAGRPAKLHNIPKPSALFGRQQQRRAHNAAAAKTDVADEPYFAGIPVLTFVP